MTEAEWQSCTDPEPMLEALRASKKASDRKLCLWGCACCRRLSQRSLLRDPRSEEAISACERLSDGVGNVGDETRARAGARAAYDSELGITYEDRHFWAAAACVAVLDGHELAAAHAATAVGCDEADHQAAYNMERTAQACFLRDIFGLLAYRNIELEQHWRNRTVQKLAQAIYAECSFDRLPILGDALEEGGCHDEVVLQHCRASGVEHVVGCWVMDMILGRA